MQEKGQRTKNMKPNAPKGFRTILRGIRCEVILKTINPALSKEEQEKLQKELQTELNSKLRNSLWRLKRAQEEQQERLQKELDSKLLDASWRWSESGPARIEKLLNKGANVNAIKWSGGFETPLICAALRGRLESAKLLIKRGADVNGKSSNDYTSLHWAAFLDDLEFVKLLLENGADANVKNGNGSTPFDAARNEEVKTLLQAAMEKPKRSQI